jgi:ribosomal protection tetracycline resistance protein
VQAQTIVLMRALRRLRTPTLFFVNKTDRPGADPDRVVDEIRDRLDVVPVPLWAPVVEQLAEHDERLLAAYLEGTVTDAETRAALAELTKRCVVHPTLRGSALTGEGVEDLRTALAGLLAGASADPDAPLAASVFKIERGRRGEKVAYLRVFAGALAVRDRVGDDKVTALEVFDHGGAAARPSVGAGEIAKVWGLHDVRVGDRIGAGAGLVRASFPRPTLEAAVEPLDPAASHRLRLALDQLAEQDPLIAVRQDDGLSVSIYGEVQKEVLEATLARDYGVPVRFQDTRPIYVERPLARGEAGELLNAASNPFHAQLGLRVEPGPEESGVEVAVDVPHDRIPLYVYKRREAFVEAMDEYVREALRSGPHGWEVTDCRVTVVDSWYSLADGPPARRGPQSTAGDFHGLTPIVLRRALAEAGTVVCEPILRIRLDVPAAALGATAAAAARLGATLDTPDTREGRAILTGAIAAATVNELQRQLPGLTRGEGVLESSFAGHRPVAGPQPVRPTGPR